MTVVRTRHDALVRVIAFGRLSLFEGHGATRLHDQLVSVAARWMEGNEQEIKAFADDADRKAIEILEQVLTEAPTLEARCRLPCNSVFKRPPPVCSRRFGLTFATRPIAWRCRPSSSSRDAAPRNPTH